ncbi:hypothetical protein AMIS_72220 [Actinoplanes missouriensis 431]|uniref:DUF3105 domain-containing protein n=1 Tax=Actinoplanes missouriensis (strain ATCC 14538 / DSM 43046 / CBS 188.64 / JCM 3121 / NBRC 102363 / NCIMB 12654 / NRRL B-3342 / UNCC 431) TaxID=512565 RepID=I0HHF5_ACTM4|nr:DUF3105 domain-containing protein [Actinoplanes missouriensis]BAL92442.1 hypothetical protein AMIS_72220 [Actinoplanes missouriensis 431]
MSMSTPGPERVPSTVKVGKTTGQGKPPAGKSATNRPGGNRPAGKGGKGKGRKPVTPVKVSGGRNWGPIAVAGAVVLIAAGIIGYGVFASVQGSKPWEEQTTAIEGVVDYRAQKNPQIDDRTHKEGAQTYVTNPPVGGAHNATWQNCMGDVYTEPIANEHAVHSLEHGAVWITYKQGLAADQVEKLKSKVEGKEYTFMSPIANLDKNISVQVWGYQLKVDSADDSRIDDFMRATRVKASMEPGAACSSGNTSTGPIAAGSNGTQMDSPTG